MSIPDMEMHISKLEQENKHLKQRIETLLGLPDLTPIHNNDSGFENANYDESVEETCFRLIIECPTFDTMDPREREMFLLEIAQQCISWVQERENY